MLEMKNEIQSKSKNRFRQTTTRVLSKSTNEGYSRGIRRLSSQKEIDEMRKRALLSKKWSKEVSEEFEKGLKKLQRMNPSMADYSVQRSYLELILELP